MQNQLINMKDFIKKLFSSGDEVSSKRFISLYSLLLFTAVVALAFCGITIPEYIVYIIAGLITGSVVSTFIKKPTYGKEVTPEQQQILDVVSNLQDEPSQRVVKGFNDVEEKKEDKTN